MSALRLGTRGSPLALYQAHAVARLLEPGGVTCEIVTIRTSGDRLAEAPLSEVGGKRLFVKEIEDALLAGTIDLAVHSSKDLPAALPDGLAIAAVLPREDPRDALVLPGGGRRQREDADEVRELLAASRRIGTSSVRRIAQLARPSRGARFLPVRGNLDTRLRKLDAGDYDALVLAAAGLRRLQRDDRISALVPVDLCVPAPGQGIIAVEIRQADGGLAERLAAVGDEAAARALRAERAVVERLGGGCQMPLGAYAVASGHRLAVTTLVASPDGADVVRAEVVGDATDPETAGVRAADELLAKGAGPILAAARLTHPATEGNG